MIRTKRAVHASLLLVVMSTCLILPAAAQKVRARVDDYTIDAELFPATHKLVAKAKVKITAVEDISIIVFELHNSLRPTHITNELGQTLTAERVTSDYSLRIPLPNGLDKGASSTLTFEYEGSLNSVDDSPVDGLKLAYVGQDFSTLLYSGRWFPVLGYGLNRFTSAINVTVPATYKVIGSGAPVPPSIAPGGKLTYHFAWTKPSFPGTILAGTYVENSVQSGGETIKTYLFPSHKDLAPNYADLAQKEFDFYTSLYGPGPSRVLNVVELPDDTVPSAWAPEIAGIASRNVNEKPNYRLLANTIAHQWFGVSTSAATTNDYWLVDGGARYAEVRYIENAAGAAGFEEATRDMSVGALAYDQIPLGASGKLDMFSPEFQSLVTDKGGMVLHMLRWVMGSDKFDVAMRNFLTTYSGKSARASDFRHVAEDANGSALTTFFSQWMDGTGAPEFKNTFTIYRIKKGFRVVGEINQDLDLFRMPMEIRIDTDGKTETKKIEVVGMRSPYSIETFGKPRKITIDPNSWVLKNSGDLRVRVSILRGQQLVAQGDLAEALKEYNKALDANNASSLARYRIGEVFFQQKNYQAAATSFRESLNGDGEPKWTEVWSHIELGKIFDATGQRERATSEYRQAISTNDNTQGALEMARKYMSSPYARIDTENL